MADWQCAASTSLPLVTLDNFDPASASQRVKDASTSAALVGHLLYDAQADPDDLTRYRICFSDILEGEHSAVVSALQLAQEALDNMGDELDDRVRSVAQGVIDAYVDSLEDADNEAEDIDENNQRESPMRPNTTDPAHTSHTFPRSIPDEYLSFNVTRTLPPGVEMGTYSITNADDGGELVIQIREYIGWWKTEQDWFIEQVMAASPSRIRLCIASPGGYVHDALAIHDFLKHYPAHVTVEITALTASAATLIAMCGDEILMSDNALFLVHPVRGGGWGTVEDMQQAIENLRVVGDTTVRLYSKKTGMSEDDMVSLMKEERYMSAAETLERGFIDQVYEPGADAAVAAILPGDEILSSIGLPAIPSEIRQARGDRPAQAPAHQGATARPLTRETVVSLVREVLAEESQPTQASAPTATPQATPTQVVPPTAPDYDTIAANLLAGGADTSLLSALTENVARQNGRR